MKHLFLFALFASGLLAQSTAAIALTDGGVSHRAGVPIGLTAASSTCSGGCTAYAWSQTAGPSVLKWSSKTSATPTVTGTVNGGYTVKVTVTPASGSPSSASFSFGAVATDSNLVTIPSSNALLSQLLGSSVLFGHGVWPELDSKQKELADLYGGLQSTEWTAYWETDPPMTGTVTIDSKTDTAIVGNGTSFLSQFNCDGTDSIVVRYTENGRTRYHAKVVTACADNTHLTWGYTENMPPGTWPFTRSTPEQQYIWSNQQSNINTYDNVLAFYLLYQRSGLTKYRDHARWLAEKWISQPFDVLGETDGDGQSQSARMHSLLGLMAYAEDGHPEVWPMLNTKLDRFVGYLNATSDLPQQDPREAAFYLWYMSVAAVHHPDAGRKATYLAAVQKALNDRWAPGRQADGSWYSWYTNEPGVYVFGPVTVTNGSTSVTSDGKFFVNDTAPNKADCGSGRMIWFTTLDDRLGDPVAYPCTVVDSSHITLATPYAGTSSTAKYFHAGGYFPYTSHSPAGANLYGPGTSSFMQGIVGQALMAAYVATNDSRLPTWITGISSWLQTKGRNASVKGLFYARNNPGCEPDPTVHPPCNFGSESDSARRALYAEVVMSMVYARQLDPESTPQSIIDEAVGVNFGSGGGPSTSDGWSSTDLATGWINATKKAKDNGFYFAIGAMSRILAERLGGPLSQTLVSRSVAFNRPANADSTVLVVSDPSGHVRSVTCSSSPCAVQIDSRQGGEAQMTIRHLSGANVVAQAPVGVI